MKSLEHELSHAYIIETENNGLVRDIVSMLCEERGVQPIDVKFMERESGAAYKVKDAEAFQEKLAMSPYGPLQVGMIEDADTLSEVIQNKLLKTLEEPEANTVIFLICSNREAFLPTVRSRCVLIRDAEIPLAPEDPDVPEDDGDERGMDVAEMLASIKEDFYIYRKFIEKNIKSKEEALAYLIALEEKERMDMLNAVSEAGTLSKADADAVTRRVRTIETAREDIARGMTYKQALKKLYLELN